MKPCRTISGLSLSSRLLAVTTFASDLAVTAAAGGTTRVPQIEADVVKVRDGGVGAEVTFGLHVARKTPRVRERAMRLSICFSPSLSPSSPAGRLAGWLGGWLERVEMDDVISGAIT